MRNQIYYVTLRVADDSRHPFGTIQNGQMELSEAGRITAAHWQQLAVHEEGVQLDAFVVMPNHLHGLVILGQQPLAIGTGFMGNGFGRSDVQALDTGLDEQAADQVQIENIIDRFLQKVVPTLKVDINKNFWHKPYEVQLIQSDKKLNALRHAIYKNPANWFKDRYYATVTDQDII